MLKQIQYEAYRFIKSRKNWIVFGLLAVLLIYIHHSNHQNFRTFHSENVRWHHSKATMANSWAGFLINFGQEHMENIGLNQEQIEKEFDYYKLEAQMLFTLHMYYNSNNPEHYTTLFDTEIKRYHRIIEALDEGELAPESIVDRGMTRQLMLNEVMLRKYVLENNISPMINPYTMTGSNAMVQFLKGDYLLILLVLIGILVMDIYLSEMEQGSYKLTFVSPLSRFEILSAKFIVGLFVAIMIILLMSLFNYLLALTTSGAGNWSYPMVTQTNLTSLFNASQPVKPMIISTSTYVTLGLFSLMTSAFFVVALVMMVSISSDSSRATLGVMVLLMVIAFIAGNFLSPNILVHLIYPFSYVYLDHVISMTHSSQYVIGLLINGFGSLILIGITYWIYQKKDFLGSRD